MNDKLLFTPGPLTTSAAVKAAMLHDLGSRDGDFLQRVKSVRERLLTIAGVAEPEYTAIPIQGSGTFGIEATLGSAISRGGKLLVGSNGAYGARIAHIARVLGIACEVVEVPESERLPPAALAAALARDPQLSHLAVVHCETSTGLCNDLAAIGAVARQHGRRFIVDAMSSFAGIAIDVAALGIDLLITSANKCLEGVPGFAIVLARRAALAEAQGSARSVSLDLTAQLRGLDADGQFRFTPPTHALLACDRALTELLEEGGVAARAARYRQNHDTLAAGMRELGFRTFLLAADQSYIITAYYCPEHPQFSFSRFYQALAERGFVIYPGKVSRADCFRIGTIGRIGSDEVRALLAAIREVLTELQLPIPLPEASK
ncbi:MAG TPA: 2-aminoethylphosphonate--pyruvate transaminase [Pseudomonadota bacterium]|nr:2-aminoethylphosphonate--pyruvate transaminase [Pseudomonadota bacterium]